ncbi:MAG: biotin--[acetyl-CoA-carboxylase] ligase [Haliscomenobacter sp.]|nr:biotin--[acetyl-CoA-carboxylase] ligase [Haliscomenobacter sp.]MBK8654997.1 biotin--[acetyl-CoA-carboxylase] ligase [Haliscomenobacter sp.]MBP9075975.1 biotin--[acetyl-CoA-carboxylase] ligase [Haliscomenobacter sp.]MBP9872544.1 biotin--[acetyl-CoA-carboxylase] ligase [Haliscomenobacter sp.]
MQNRNTLFLGKVLLQFSDLPSTNEYAAELLAKSKPTEGTVISAHYQSAGRGQIGSSWESAPGENLTISILLYPVFLEATRQFQLNKAIALGVRDFLAAYIPHAPVYVKWPNDLYIHSKKAGGILIQNALQKNTLQSAIIGIGLNINQATFSEAAPYATSLFLETGQVFDLSFLLHELCYFLEVRYLALKQGSEERLNQDYLSHLYRFEEPSYFQRASGEVFLGKICGISDIGKLQIDQAGAMEEFGLKEVSFVNVQ